MQLYIIWLSDRHAFSPKEAQGAVAPPPANKKPPPSNVGLVLALCETNAQEPREILKDTANTTFVNYSVFQQRYGELYKLTGLGWP